ncbi:hypothetical protein JCM10213_008299 [Rhodosporidiobolus nylandii]
MLLRLPVELVERIMRLALPVEITGTTYSERQAILRACCLVSSRLRAIVQPILEEALWIRYGRGISWKQAKDSLSRLGKRLRFLWVAEHWEARAADFAALLSSCTGLRDLRLCHWRAFNLCTLKDLSGLRRLVLDYVNLDGTICPLHSVTELSLCYVTTMHEACETVLPPTTFPSLRHLFFTPDAMDSLLPSPSLFSSLVSIVIAMNSLAHGTMAYEHPSISCLGQVYEDFLDGALWIELCEHAEHVQIVPDSYWNPAETDVLDGLADALEHCSSPPSIRLRLVYLPSAFSACTCDTCKKCNNLARFRRACAARGISVETEDYEDQYGAWVGSRKFVAYAEQKKREREAEQVAG